MLKNVKHPIFTIRWYQIFIDFPTESMNFKRKARSAVLLELKPVPTWSYTSHSLATYFLEGENPAADTSGT